MQQFNVMGMTCAACSSRVERAVGKVDGVSSVSVNLLTNSMVVEGTASSEKIITAVVDAGYGIRQVDSGSKYNNGSETLNNLEEVLKDRETPIMMKRFAASIILLIPLMYVSMGHVMWGWRLPDKLEDNYFAIGLLQLLLTTIIMVVNQKFFINGIKGALKKSPNMDTLVALGSGASYVYSVYSLFEMSNQMMLGNNEKAMHYIHELYFESTAMILALITLGKMLEARSKGKTTDAIKSLMKLAPKVANVIRDGKEIEVAIDDVKIDDVFVVRPGENIPVDGVVLEGSSAVDESALTGESIPVDKEIGNEIYAATINQSGYIKCRAKRVGQDTTLSQIIQMVSNAAATKAPIAKIADKVSGVFVPIVTVIAIAATMVWLLGGQTVGYALARGISVLVISCPCALGLATPVAIMVGNGVGAKNGILFKTAVSLEETGKVNVVALDKTGTITVGMPRVTDVICACNVREDELLPLAYTLEKMSEHPLAKAVVEYCENRNGNQFTDSIKDFRAVAGNGLTAMLDNQELVAGNYKFIKEHCTVPCEISERVELLSKAGKTPLYFAKAGRLMGVISVADVIKSDSVEAVLELKKLGIHVVMLTGDNEITARAIGEQVGVDEVVAGVMPDAKEKIIMQLKGNNNKVVMVGDGINDAPALTRADIGMAIGAGTDIAVEAADVVLMKNSLRDVAAAIRLSRKVLKNIRENLFWAFIYNIIGIPLAAGLFIPVFGWTLNPMFGAAAMSLSSFCVVTNSLRLNFINVHSSKADKPIKSGKRYKTAELGAAHGIAAGCGSKDGCKLNKEEKGDKVMTKVMKIEGMMCGHCEARVKKVLEAFSQVDEALVSHEENEAIVKLNTEITDEELIEAVEAQDYKVISVD